MFFKKLLFYLNPFSKSDPSQKGNINLKMMHGVNRISILLFLVALVIWLFRHAF